MSTEKHYSGTLTDSKDYDVFGTPLSVTNGLNSLYESTVSTSYGYLGKPYDATTRLYNYGYRDYSSRIGRFTTVDPIRDGSNWYAYVNNDPVNYVDLWGLEQNAEQKRLVEIYSDLAAHSPRIAQIVKENTIIVIQRSELDNGENGKYFQSTESVKLMGQEVNSIPIQSTADYNIEGSLTINPGEYKGTLLNKSGSYNNAISITGNGVSQEDGVLQHPNAKTAKGQMEPYANDVRPLSAGCQIPHLKDFNETTDIVMDLGFRYGASATGEAWAKGDEILIDIREPVKKESK